MFAKQMNKAKPCSILRWITASSQATYRLRRFFYIVAALIPLLLLFPKKQAFRGPRFCYPLWIASLLFMFVLARRIELIVHLFAECNGAKRDSALAGEVRVNSEE